MLSIKKPTLNIKRQIELLDVQSKSEKSKNLHREQWRVISLAGVQMKRNQVNKSGAQDQSSPLFYGKTTKGFCARYQFVDFQL